MLSTLDDGKHKILIILEFMLLRVKLENVRNLSSKRKNTKQFHAVFLHNRDSYAKYGNRQRGRVEKFYVKNITEMTAQWLNQ